MGVDLGDLLKRKKIEIKDLSGRWVAIDAFNGTDTPGRIWDALERRHREMKKT